MGSHIKPLTKLAPAEQGLLHMLSWKMNPTSVYRNALQKLKLHAPTRELFMVSVTWHVNMKANWLFWRQGKLHTHLEMWLETTPCSEGVVETCCEVTNCR